MTYFRPPPFAHTQMAAATPPFLQSSAPQTPPLPVLQKMLADLVVSAEDAICRRPQPPKPLQVINAKMNANLIINGNRSASRVRRAARKPLGGSPPALQTRQSVDRLKFDLQETVAACCPRPPHAASLMELLRHSSETEDTGGGQLPPSRGGRRGRRGAQWVREGSRSSKSSLDRWTGRSGNCAGPQGVWEDFYGLDSDFARQSGLNSPSYESASTSNNSAAAAEPAWTAADLNTTLNNNESPQRVEPAVLLPTEKGGAQFTVIANVPSDTVRQDLVFEFRKFGRVELAMVVCDEASRHPHKEWTSTAGYAFVRFSRRSEAAAAIQAAALGLITIRGTRVRADWARKDSYAKRGRGGPPPLNKDLSFSGGDLVLLARVNRSMSANNVESKRAEQLRLNPSKLERMTTTGGRINSCPENTDDQLFGAILKDSLLREGYRYPGSRKSADTPQRPQNCECPSCQQTPTHGMGLKEESGVDADLLAFLDTYGMQSDFDPCTGEVLKSLLTGTSGDVCARRVDADSQTLEEFEDYLSPCSKKLLMIALKDVATCGMNSPAAAKATSIPRRLTPEELLHRAVEAYERNEELGRCKRAFSGRETLTMTALAN